MNIKECSHIFKGSIILSVGVGTERSGSPTIPTRSSNTLLKTSLHPLSESLNHGTTEMHLLFVDYVKTFVSVAQNEIREIMAEKGFPVYLI
jgi:hypothetical protein